MNIFSLLLKKISNYSLKNINKNENNKIDEEKKTLKNEKKELERKIIVLNKSLSEYSIKVLNLERNQKEQKEKNLELEKENSILKWCSPSVSEIPYVEKKELLSFVKNSLEKSNIFTKTKISGFAALASRDNFKSNEAWAFYWVISHAIACAMKSLHKDVNENAISNTICLEIERQATWYKSEFDEHVDIEINIAQLYNHLNTNLDELHTGADILFVISGRGLVEEECAKIFWIQAKRSTNKTDPFKVNYFQENSLHKNQCAALQSIHCEEKGSIGMYMNYTKQLPFIAAITVDKLDSQKSSEDFSLHGSRFQELLLSKIISKNGYFNSPEAAAEYIENISVNHNLPLKIISFQSSNEEFGPKLIRILSTDYDKKIGFNGP